MSAPIPIAVAVGEGFLVPYFLIPAVVAFAIGVLLQRFPRAELSLGNAMVLVTLAWILLSLFGSVPYMFGNNMSFIDSYFESMSGFTATGLTMISGPPGAPPHTLLPCPQTILLWRSLTEWVGGMGVIVLFLAALLGAGKAARKMYVAEARAERIEPSIRETARSLWKIYVLLTIIGIIGLYFTGMPLFDAVNHSMTGIATGGFTVRNTSFAGYGGPVLSIAIILMLAGAVSFAVHRKVMGGQWRELFKNVEVQLMLTLIALVTIILVWSVGVQKALFQSTSALTGTGFSTAALSGWGDLQKGMLTVLMVIGGGYGSTSSAIKLIRTIIIVKAVLWLIKRSFLPERAVVPMKLAGRVYNESEIMETAIYAFIYVLVLVGGAIVLMMLGNPAMNAMFESASAQGNVGLSVGITSAAMPAVGKVVFIIQMLVGRLEILPVIALASFFISKVRPRPRAF
jgi:trk system potassium uptake protein TrkH